MAGCDDEDDEEDDDEEAELDDLRPPDVDRSSARPLREDVERALLPVGAAPRESWYTRRKPLSSTPPHVCASAFLPHGAQRPWGLDLPPAVVFVSPMPYRQGGRPVCYDECAQVANVTVACRTPLGRELAKNEVRKRKSERNKRVSATHCI